MSDQAPAPKGGRRPGTVDPATVLEHLESGAGYPLGYYDRSRRRYPVFTLTGALLVAICLVPFHTSVAELAVAAGLFVALTVAAMTVPWRALPPWAWLVLPVGYLAVIALVRDALGGYRSGVVYLFLLPIVWLALHGRRRHIVIGLVALFLAFLVPLLWVGSPSYPPGQWRQLVLGCFVAGLIAFSFAAIVDRERAYLVDLAGQSVLAEQHAEEASEARQRLDSILAAATTTAVIGVDRHGLITFFSSGAEELLGHRSDEVDGRSRIYDFAEPHELGERAAELAALVSAAAEGRPSPEVGRESIWTFVRKDGTRRRGAITLTSRTDDTGALGFVVVANDVTEREQLAVGRDRLLAAQREVTEVLAEQNNRLRELTQMKDDVVATVSHELRTPLTSIRGFVELLLADQDAGLDPEQVRMLRTIDRNSLQLLRVADDLLADPGGSSGLRVRFVDTDLSVVAADALDTMTAQADQRGIELSLDAPVPVLVHGDPARLHQLFGNLLSNALKFTAPGGRVMVRVDTLGEFARLEVLDDGPGIPATDRPQLFDRFYRLADSEYSGIPGTGLGLFIAKSVVEAHQGTVDVVDTPGWSTTFRVLLPLADRPARAAAGPAAQSPAAQSPAAQSPAAQSPASAATAGAARVGSTGSAPTTRSGGPPETVGGARAPASEGRRPD